jgi:hypothetical protein
MPRALLSAVLSLSILLTTLVAAQETLLCYFEYLKIQMFKYINI